MNLCPLFLDVFEETQKKCISEKRPLIIDGEESTALARPSCLESFRDKVARNPLGNDVRLNPMVPKGERKLSSK
jgi:hypothetical protein